MYLKVFYISRYTTHISRHIDDKLGHSFGLYLEQNSNQFLQHRVVSSTDGVMQGRLAILQNKNKNDNVVTIVAPSLSVRGHRVAAGLTTRLWQSSSLPVPSLTSYSQRNTCFRLVLCAPICYVIGDPHVLYNSAARRFPCFSALATRRVPMFTHAGFKVMFSRAFPVIGYGMFLLRALFH